jgi:hypothetical protein
MIVVGALALVALAYYVLVPLLFRLRPVWFRDSMHHVRGLLVKGCIAGMGVLYPSVSYLSLAVFRCQSVGSSSYLSADLSIDCNSPSFRAVWFFNVFFFIIFVLGWLALLLLYLRRASRALNSANLGLVAASNPSAAVKEAARRSILALQELHGLIEPRTASGADANVAFSSRRQNAGVKADSREVNKQSKAVVALLLGLKYQHFNDLKHATRVLEPELAAAASFRDFFKVEVNSYCLQYRVGFLYKNYRRACR